MTECRPWEWIGPGRPWESSPGGDGIYGRRVTVKRPRTVASGPGGVEDVGLTDYSGMEQTSPDSTTEQGEDVLFTDLPANISVTSAGRSRGPLPADVVYRTVWQIVIPASSGVGQFDIRDRDIVVDDESYRYSVTAAYWTGFGYTLHVIRLEM